MRQIHWDDSLATGVMAIDNQHREIFKRFNSLLKACERGHSRDELVHVLHFMNDYIIRHFQEEGADGVLTIQTIKVQQESSYQPGYFTNYPGYWYPSAFPAWNLYGYYGSIGYYEPPYITTWEVATIQVSLFDQATGKLRWAGTVQSSEPEKSIALTKDIARLVIEALVKERII